MSVRRLKGVDELLDLYSQGTLNGFEPLEVAVDMRRWRRFAWRQNGRLVSAAHVELFPVPPPSHSISCVHANYSRTRSLLIFFPRKHANRSKGEGDGGRSIDVKAYLFNVCLVPAMENR